MKELKATAVANASQALMAFHGFINADNQNLPVDTLFCTLKGLSTMTTIEFLKDEGSPTIKVNGKDLTKSENERVHDFVLFLAERYDLPKNFILHSKNSFASACGLGSSSSAFAATTYAICSIARVDDISEITWMARLGSISAANSVLGGLSRLFGRSDKPSAKKVMEEGSLPFVVFCIPVLEARKTLNAHREARLSPIYDKFCEISKNRVDIAIQLLDQKKYSEFGNYVEEQMLTNIATISTGPSHNPVWHPSALRFFLELNRNRLQLQSFAFLAMNSGPSIFCYTSEEDMNSIQAILKDLGLLWIEAKPGAGAKLTESHLF